METIFPTKLKAGDTLAIIAPSRSLAIVSQENRSLANERFKELDLNLIFSQHIEKKDMFNSSSVESRVDDLHEAFSNPEVAAILTVIGGFNVNQLLQYIDWNIIHNNPKILCGFSDITALSNAIYAKTGLVGYSGPHYSSFGQKLHFDYTLEYFRKCLMDNEPFAIKPSTEWSDDAWYKDQDKRELITNEGWLVINPGQATGTLIGGNLCTLKLLAGTEYMPSLKDSVLFIEDDELAFAEEFDRNLQSLLHLPDFPKVRGLVIGRFQKASKMTNEKIIQIVKTKQELNNIPVIANVDFGHTDPKITFPVGGNVTIDTNTQKITIQQH